MQFIREIDKNGCALYGMQTVPVYDSTGGDAMKFILE